MATAIDWTKAITGMFALGLRVSGLLVFLPVLGGNAIAARIKASLVVIVTFVLYPVCHPAGFDLTLAMVARLLCSELLIGLLIGLSVQCVFESAQLAGQFMGTQVGFSLVNVLDPNSQVDTPVLSVLLQTLATLLFLQMNVHHWLLRAVVSSYAYLPAGAEITKPQVCSEVLHAVGGIWLAGVQIAAPCLITTLLIDLSLGFLGKASPQLPVLFLGLSVKSLAGLSILALSLRYWPAMFERWFTSSIHGAERLLSLSR